MWWDCELFQIVVGEGVARNKKIGVGYIDRGKGAGVQCISGPVGGIVSGTMGN
jgi:hypothetical protein